ncbi:lipoprotein [Spiroplasma endosymbiont of Seladonia tumulorum]|uniref:lipoprotein n=1 Tax=Spiroplasma endosymbiont of Seladonia tumulorum TaxID=3066321 RepID=UPI0030D432BF
MKKILSILGAIGLTATNTTSLVACDKPKPNNNENGGGNKPEPTPEPQQPPENSNWKLVTDIKNEFKEKNNKWYFFCIERTDFTLKKYYSTSLWENNGINIEYNNAKNIKIGFETIKIIDIKSIYRWDGKGEPQTPQIDTNTGKITDWKE